MKVFFRLAGSAVGLALFLCSLGISGQTNAQRITATVMLDEYGPIRGCDHSARLDNFVIALQNSPELESYIVYYGPESAGEQTFAYIKEYLVNSRGVSEERWKTIYAGPNSDPREPRIQLWLAPPDAPPPELVRYESKLETFNGQFMEYERLDGVAVGGAEDGGTGPRIPDVSAPTFIEMLRKRKDTLAYIVTFSGTETGPGAWRRIAQLESEELQAKGVTADRVRTIYGGSDQDSRATKVQLWILPVNAPPPVADAGAEQPPNRTMQIGTQGDYELGDERVERWAFKVLLDGLRQSEELRACLIVRLAEEEETGEQTPLITDDAAIASEASEPQPADLLKLIDKWRVELTDKYKIRPDRLIVLFAKARNYETDILETWIVPPGAQLPDPNAEPEEATSAEDERLKAATEKDVHPVADVKSDKARAEETQTEKAQPEKKEPPQLLLPAAQLIK